MFFACDLAPGSGEMQLIGELLPLTHWSYDICAPPSFCESRSWNWHHLLPGISQSLPSVLNDHSTQPSLGSGSTQMARGGSLPLSVPPQLYPSNTPHSSWQCQWLSRAERGLWTPPTSSVTWTSHLLPRFTNFMKLYFIKCYCVIKLVNLWILAVIC